MKRILVVDDDEHVCDLVRIVLEADGFRVETVLEGKQGLHKIETQGYDLIILDIMLPGVDGWEICRRIRSGPARRTPVIMLTAKGEEIDKVLGLEVGADDYITKPFSPRVLLARVKALLRRVEDYDEDNGAPDPPLQTGNLEIDIEKYTVVAHGKQRVELTPKEIQLLALMARNNGRVFPRETLLELIWGYSYPGGSRRTIDEHIKRLRKKLAGADPHLTYIQTVWGIGYKFEVRER